MNRALAELTALDFRDISFEPNSSFSTSLHCSGGPEDTMVELSNDSCQDLPISTMRGWSWGWQEKFLTVKSPLSSPVGECCVKPF